MNYRQDAAAAKEILARLREMPAAAPCIAVQAEVSNEAQVQRMLEQVRATLGPVQYLVNNAGIVDGACKVADMSVARGR